MTAPDPFAYPAAVHDRKHAPAGYVNYRKYKPWLRDDFSFRCVYCLHREMWTRDRQDAFAVDHVAPQSDAPDLALDYGNLVYSCLRCNSARRDVRVFDPTREAAGRHLRAEPDGVVTGLSEEGEFLVELLHLNRGSALQERRRIRRILDRWNKLPDDESVRRDFLESFGYPDDLPDLRRLKPPGGNALAVNAGRCFYALRQRGELARTY